MAAAVVMEPPQHTHSAWPSRSSMDAFSESGGAGTGAGSVGGCFNVELALGSANSLLSGPLDSPSPPASPPIDSVVSAACSSPGDLSPARASYLHTLLKRFPCPTRSNLSSLTGLVLESAVQHSSQSIVNALLLPHSPWLPSLYRLCGQLELEADVSALQSLFALLVAIVNLHDSQLLSLLFDRQHALHSLTVLEYDPAIIAHLASSNQPDQLTLPLRRHCHAMRNSHCLSLPLDNGQPHSDDADGGDGHSGGGGCGSGQGSSSDSVNECMHHLHRLEYAKDVVLLSHLDDPTTATLSQLCAQQRVQVIHQVQRDTTVHQLCRAMHVAADAMHEAQRHQAAQNTEGAVVSCQPVSGYSGSSGQYGMRLCTADDSRAGYQPGNARCSDFTHFLSSLSWMSLL